MQNSKDNVVALSPVPLYTQIKEIIRSCISNGTYSVLEQMPSESEMMKTFNVSRITVRQALGDLQKDGLIFKIPGKGTFVAKSKAVQNLTRLQGFAEAMTPLGYETSSRVIGIKNMRADKNVARHLQLPEKSPVTKIQRVRHLNGEPISVDITYVPVAIGARLMQEDLARRDIFLILENAYGYALGSASVQIEAVLADHITARLLAVEEGAPLLRIERLTCTRAGQPLDYEHLFYRGDAFQYRLSVERGLPLTAAHPQELHA